VSDAIPFDVPRVRLRTRAVVGERGTPEHPGALRRALRKRSGFDAEDLAAQLADVDPPGVYAQPDDGRHESG
jgi:hypothetical protein